MSLANHLEELQRKHGDIEREIDEALFIRRSTISRS